MDLQELRQKIDEIDDSLVDLFQRRMDVSAEIAQYKQEHNLPVYDPARERQKLHNLSGRVKEGREAYVTALYSLLFELSRAEQERILNRNIVLIGMPGCGKTSIGAELANKMGRVFADTDAWIAKTAGKPVPSIIAEDGEDRLRKLETDALKALCKQSGLIIATGGGVVKRPGNRSIIRQNGIIVFLDRDISQLSVSGRPLSERDGIAALAAERLPLYSQWSEYTVPVRSNGSDPIGQTALDIMNILRK